MYSAIWNGESVISREVVKLAKVTKPQIKTRLYTIKEASELWNVPLTVLYGEIRQGRLRAVMRRGCVKGYLVTEQIMADWIENSMVDVFDVKGGLV